MKNLRSALFGALVLSGSLFAAMSAFASEQARTVVLVHGAFADGSSWNRVIPLLQASGLKTISVQNPLSSLKDDVAFTNRAIEQAQGPVVLVGHSWGGMVITEAGDTAKVKSLVYVSAFAPSKGESIHDAVKGAKKVPGLANPIVDKAGFIALSEETVVKYFASDVPEGEAKLIAATQGKIFGKALDDKVTRAAWQTKPSWFVISEKDQMIHPDLMRAMAKKIKAKTVSLPTSHVPMLSKPEDVARVIIDAAKAQ